MATVFLIEKRRFRKRRAESTAESAANKRLRPSEKLPEPSENVCRSHCSMDECACARTERPSVCKNNATGSNTVGGYSIICVNECSGADCSQNIDDCAGAACFNGATCHLEDTCASNPCHVGAICNTSPIDGTYICSCPSGFKGVDECEEGRKNHYPSRPAGGRRPLSLVCHQPDRPGARALAPCKGQPHQERKRNQQLDHQEAKEAPDRTMAKVGTLLKEILNFFSNLFNTSSVSCTRIRFSACFEMSHEETRVVNSRRCLQTVERDVQGPERPIVSLIHREALVPPSRRVLEVDALQAQYPVLPRASVMDNDQRNLITTLLQPVIKRWHPHCYNEIIYLLLQLNLSELLPMLENHEYLRAKVELLVAELKDHFGY